MANKNSNTVKQERNSNAKRGGSRKRGHRSRGKEFEVNLPDASLNKADLPHVVTDSKGPNDVAWYKNIPTLVKDYANVFFATIAGLTYDPQEFQNPTTPTWTPGDANYRVTTPSGILELTVAPIMGLSTAGTSPANIAAEQLYNLIRKENSGARNYDKTDVMVVGLSLNSAYMLYEVLIRVYRLLGSYTWENRYLPDVLVEMMGFDPGALRSNYASFRGVLDMMAYRLASINFPDQFDFIKRQSWLFSNVYKDSETNVAQMYYFKPAGFYVLNESGITQDNLNILKWNRFDEVFGKISGINLDDIQTAIDTILNPIMGSQDIGVISGDIAKAFGGNGMIAFKAVEDYSELQPIYSKEVLMEIENATVFDTIPNNMDIKMSVAQSTDLKTGPILLQNPYFPETRNMAAKSFRKTLVNFHHQDPTTDDILVATRFTASIRYQPGPTTGYYFNTVGTEIVTGARFGTIGYNSNGTITYLTSAFIQDVVQSGNGVTGVDTLNAINLLADWSKFDWAPTIYTYSISTDDEPEAAILDMENMICDIDKFAWIEKSTLEKINDCCVMSLYKVKDYPINQ